jgi:hypothetical protein
MTKSSRMTELLRMTELRISQIAGLSVQFVKILVALRNCGAGCRVPNWMRAGGPLRLFR